MIAFLLRRLVYTLPIMLGVALVCFALVHLAPGDPLVSILPPDASGEMQAQMRTLYGFDRSYPEQFASWVWRAVQGDLGTSIASGRSVTDEVLKAVGNTLRLAVVRHAHRLHLRLPVRLCRRLLPEQLGRQGSVGHRGAGRERAALLAGHGDGHRLRRHPGLAAAGRRRAGRLGRLGLELGAHAAPGAAGRHDERDPDGHHRAHRACAGGRHPGAGVHRRPARQGPDRHSASSSTW